MCELKEPASYWEPESVDIYEEEVDKRIRKVIEEGIESIGTDEECLLYTRYARGEISKDDIYKSIEDEVRKVVNDELEEERISNCDWYE